MLHPLTWKTGPFSSLCAGFCPQGPMGFQREGTGCRPGSSLLLDVSTMVRTRHTSLSPPPTMGAWYHSAALTLCTSTSGSRVMYSQRLTDRFYLTSLSTSD